MGDKTSISWTSSTWNMLRGCSVVSAGCENCYAMGVGARFSDKGQPYEGLAKFSAKRRLPQWTGKVRIVPKHIADPLRWTKPRRIFVNSMSDAFHEEVSNETIAGMFGIMAAAPQHQFQLLTKRAGRMKEWFEWFASMGGASQPIRAALAARDLLKTENLSAKHLAKINGCDASGKILPWPLPNVWIGVSAENQRTADERIPKLLRVPAAVYFVSYEPALGPVVFHDEWLRGTFSHCPDETADPATDECNGCPALPPHERHADGDHCGAVYTPRLDWVIVGGESGPRARPFDVAWARSVVRQCKDARVACFVKQMGAHVRTDGIQLAGDWWPDGSPGEEDGLGLTTTTLGAFRKRLKDKKGEALAEWPKSLQVRQFPDEARP